VVLVHGAWGGAWDWRETADSLESLGYETHRVTLTGLGERSHLLSPEIDLTTHVTDVVNVLRWEGLEDVILVGHSYGGMVITGVAEIVPERIRRLVYFDAFLPLDGECAVAIGRDEGPEEACREESLAEGSGMSVVDDAVPAGWVEEGAPVPKDVPHPAGTLVEPLDLAGDPGHGVPIAYIITREEAGGEDGFDVPAARAGALGWPVVEYLGNHVPYREDPGGIARLLVSFEGASGS
jgi:pimeloyl-ACP methyl ester carboxylesterase